MNTNGISFDNIPALKIPLLFFSRAPLFGMLAALILCVDPSVLSSRWNPNTLAVVHLLTLGFASHIMLGALCQVMPVVSSEPIPLTLFQAKLIRLGASVGTLLIAASLGLQQPMLASLGIIALGLGFGFFAVRLTTALLRVKPAGFSAIAIRFAAISLLITLLSGALLLWWRFDATTAPALMISTDQHAGWGTLGWGLLLIIGVSFQVIPMFHVTPDFPRWLCRILPALLFSLLVLSSLDIDSLQYIGKFAINLTVMVFCAMAAFRLQQRKRKLLDYTVRFWRLGLGCIGLSMLISAADTLLPELLSELSGELTRPLQIAPLLGVLFGIGGIISIIMGMLQKIIPFLIYLHLQRACLTQPEKLMQLPHMKQLVPTSRSRWQWRLHLGSLFGLLMSLWFPALTLPSALMLLVSFGWLWWTLTQAFRLYAITLAPAK